MQIIKVLCSMIASVAFFALLAQSDSDYQGWMKQVVTSNGNLTKGIAAKDASAAAEAITLESVFKQVESFWSKKVPRTPWRSRNRPIWPQRRRAKPSMQVISTRLPRKARTSRPPVEVVMQPTGAERRAPSL
jgi:hypothetical protein